MEILQDGASKESIRQAGDEMYYPKSSGCLLGFDFVVFAATRTTSDDPRGTGLLMTQTATVRALKKASRTHGTGDRLGWCCAVGQPDDDTSTRQSRCSEDSGGRCTEAAYCVWARRSIHFHGHLY